MVPVFRAVPMPASPGILKKKKAGKPCLVREL
jgi:hypothetical protein